MHTIDIPAIKYKAQFASCIDELTTKQFIFFCKLITWFQQEEINHSEFRLLLLIDLLQLKFNPSITRKHPLTEYQKLNLHQLAETLNSFFEDKNIEGNTSKILKLNFSRNMLPTLRTSIFKSKLYGPKEYLNNCEFFEYVEAQRYFIAYTKSEDFADLDKMIACLYRPKKWFHLIRKYLPNYNGELRQKFNEHHVSRRAKQISKLAPEVRFGVYLFFRNCEEQIQSGEMEINGTSLSFKDLFKKKDDEDKGVNLGWVGLLYTLAESGVFGNIKETASQNLYDVMLRVYQVVKDNEKMMAKYGKDKNIS